MFPLMTCFEGLIVGTGLLLHTLLRIHQFLVIQFPLWFIFIQNPLIALSHLKNFLYLVRETLHACTINVTTFLAQSVSLNYFHVLSPEITHVLLSDLVFFFLMYTQRMNIVTGKHV